MLNLMSQSVPISQLCLGIQDVFIKTEQGFEVCRSVNGDKKGRVHLLPPCPGTG